MKTKIFLSIFLILFGLSNIECQTVGVTDYTENSIEGYTFFSPFSSTQAYLIDNCGRLVNLWERGTRPGLSAYLLDNGLILRTYKVNPQGPFTSASNAGGLELADWNNNTVWSYEINTPTWLSHHDAVMMPNGNILVLTWELVYRNELIELGRNPNEIASQNFMWSEKIIEIRPLGSDGAEIVWEWNIKDHYIQDFDPTKEGYGVVSEHPELFNINLPELNSSNSNSSRDWNHFNAIDYNEELDQILISVRNSDEIWIIDHSTTTEEASGHTGGIYGKGGDILYRWGNASAYERAPVSDQKLFGQHGVNWIREGLPEAGKILIYNNGNGRPGTDYSTVEILIPDQGEPGHYIIPENQAIGPELPDWTYGDESHQRFYSPYLSNAQMLPNGNILVNAGSIGTIFEINTFKNIDWKYIIPLNGDFPVQQGQIPFDNGTFRAYKFEEGFSGFDGVDLTPGSPMEINPIECQVTTSNDETIESTTDIIHNHTDNTLLIESQSKDDLWLLVFDLLGKSYVNYLLTPQEFNIFNLPQLSPGIYLVNILSENRLLKQKKIVVGY